ncbi:MAG: TerB family tellurite resistance protein [Deltaproteobacteria bacterium]|nr:TerB family tellurite resistance protein [Deltaproteobacteria bacterium]
MDDDARLEVIKIWAAMVWADGKVVPAERASLGRLVSSVPALDARTRARALDWLDHPVELAPGTLEGLSIDARTEIYRAAVALAGLDGEVHAAERRLLLRLAERLELGADTTSRIEAGVSRRA